MKIIFAIGPKTNTETLNKLTQEREYKNVNYKIYYLYGLEKKELLEKIINLKNKIIGEELASICILLNFDENIEQTFTKYAFDFYNSFGDEGLKCLTFGIQKTLDFKNEQYEQKLYNTTGYKFLNEKKQFFQKFFNFFLV